MVMEQYLINDTTLSAIGDAIRQVKGEEKYFPVIGYSHTSNVDSEGNIEGSYNSEVFTEVITLPGASSIKVTFTFKGAGTAHQACLSVWEGNHPDYTISANYKTSLCSQLYSKGTHNLEYIIEGDSVTFGFYSSGSQTGYGYYAIVESLDDIKINPNTNYLPSEFSQQITEITTLDTLEVTENGTYTPGEDSYGFDEVIVNIDMSNTIPPEAFFITGDCRYRFANDGWDWFIKQCGDKITTKDITYVDYMFYYSKKIEDLSFLSINMKNASIDTKYMFAYADKLKKLPKINNLIPEDMDNMFYGCKSLREIPSSFYENWDWSKMDNQTSGYSCNRKAQFQDCQSLRSLPIEFLKHANPATTYSYSMYGSMCSNCYALDEIVGLPIPYTATWTSNGFSGAVSFCSRLKDFTFALQDNGTPYAVKWRSQTIDLSSFVGYMSAAYISNLLNLNSGITEDTQVTDDATYQALKDNPDWWTTDIAYSRYNHDSAVATLNSLPDASAYLTGTYTNTIKFKGAAGSATDGGAINTLTAEEIAVATAKGWTVTLV